MEGRHKHCALQACLKAGSRDCRTRTEPQQYQQRVTGDDTLMWRATEEPSTQVLSPLVQCGLLSDQQLKASCLRRAAAAPDEAPILTRAVKQRADARSTERFVATVPETAMLCELLPAVGASAFIARSFDRHKLQLPSNGWGMSGNKSHRNEAPIVGQSGMTRPTCHVPSSSNFPPRGAVFPHSQHIVESRCCWLAASGSAAVAGVLLSRSRSPFAHVLTQAARRYSISSCASNCSPPVADTQPSGY